MRNNLLCSHNYELFKIDSCSLVRGKAWLYWILAVSFFFYKNILEVSPSVMTEEWMHTFSITGESLGYLAATYYYAYLFMQIPVGIFLDRFGTRLFPTIAIAIVALSTVCLSQTNSVVIASLMRFFIGIGSSFAAITCIKMINIWFPQNRFAFMSGLMMMVAMLGASGGSYPLSIAVTTYGWRKTLFFIGLIGIFISVIYYIAVREKNDITKDIIFNNFKKGSLFLGLRSILINKQAWILSLYSGLSFAPVAVLGGLWGVSYIMETYNVPKTIAASIISHIFIGFSIGCPVSGWFSDRIGKRLPVMAYGTTIAFLLLLCILYIPNQPLLFVVTEFFTFGVCISTFLLSFSMIKEVTPRFLCASSIGFMNAFDALLCAISEPLIGKLLDFGWTGQLINGARHFTELNFRCALLILPIYLFLALFFLCIIKETYGNQLD
ncbi:MAG: MFS transporter [Alphaproteobacteria bacterium]|nr:MFS transporter [Alphaproteobacteria bacterium]